MNGKKEERAGQSPRSESTVESYHDVEATREAYAAGEQSAAGEGTGRKLSKGPIPELLRRERDWLVGTAKERGRLLLSARMSSLGAVARDVAEVLHTSAQRLSSEEDETTAHYFNLAADGVDQMASTLLSPDFETLVARTRNFARTHPVLFFSGMATAGFMVSRFLKSSPEEAGGSAGQWRRETWPETGTVH